MGEKELIFCPTCKSRSVAIGNKKGNSLFRCTRAVCGREFRVRKNK